jgi:uncharacterized membrane protein YebE (DUF533 family)
MMNKISMMAAIVAAAALPALAQTATPGIDKREANQQARIQQGVQSGQLTPKEAAKLERGQAKVDAMEAKAKSDGVATAKERKKIAKEQNKQSRKIYREKHDNQTTAPKSS